MACQMWNCSSTTASSMELRSDAGTSDSDKSGEKDSEEVRFFKAKMRQQFKKTMMCKFHILGMCNRGEQCVFAHNASELKGRPDLSRTKICDEFQMTGRCSQANCMFAHDATELRTTFSFHKTKHCWFWAAGKCENGSRCRFAHDVNELTPTPEKPNVMQQQHSELKKAMPKKQNNQSKQPQIICAPCTPGVPQLVPVPEYLNTSQMEVSRPPPGLEMFARPSKNAHYGLFETENEQPGLGVFSPAPRVPHVVAPLKAGKVEPKQTGDLKYLLEQLSVEQVGDMAMGA